MSQTYNNLKTPCYILDITEIEKSISGFHLALENSFKQSAIGYSVKTNSLPYSMSVARNLCCYAEVVSADEYELALLCRYPKNRIIYNGPMKSKESFVDAIVNGAVVNIETHRELEWLVSLPKDRTYNIGLRLNVNISKVSPEDAQSSNDNSRFGFSDDTDELFVKKIYFLPALLTDSRKSRAPSRISSPR